MPGELIVKNGLRVSGSTIIVGSITATSFTGSFSGSITNATSASFAVSSSFSSTASFYGGSVTSASFASTSSFPWFQTGSNIAYVGGNILVNTTTNAGFRLDVNGTTRFTGDSYVTTGDFLLDNDRPIRWKDSGGTFRRAMLITAANDFQFGPVDTGWGATTYLKSGGAMQFAVNGASGTFAAAVTINTSANVAIGTTSPSTRLHVRGSGTTSGTTAFRVENANASASLEVRDDRLTRITSEGAALYVEGAGVSPFSQNIAEFRYAGNGNSLIIAQQNGIAGLTTSTNTDLHINPNGTGTTVFLQGKQVRFFNSSNNSNIALQNNGATGQARLDFITGSTTIMSISGSGNVGIGTTTPAARLQVGGTPNDSIAFDADHTLFNGVNARFPGRVIVGASSTQYPKIMYNAIPLSSSNSWSYAANDTAWAINMGGSNRMGFEYVSAGTAGNTFSSWNTIMSLVSGSNSVGIGTTAPTTTLDVIGSGRYTGNLTVVGLISASSFTGSLSGSATNAVSASFASTASFYGGSVTSASYALSSSFASTASFYGGSVTSASFAATASTVLGGTAGYIPLWSTDTSLGSSVLFQSGSNIGIGNSPQNGFKLDVGGQSVLRGNIYTSGSLIDFGTTEWNIRNNTFSFLGRTYSVVVGTTSSISAKLGVQGTGTTSATTALLVQNANTSASLVVRDDSSVGIGTATPAYRLEIYGNPTNATINLAKSDGDQYLRLIGGSGGANQLIQTAYNLGIDVGGAGNRAMTFLSGSANVGIGTTAPTARLQVKGSGTTSSTTAFRVENANATASLTVADDGRVAINGSIYGSVAQKLEVISDIAGPIAAFGARSVSAPMSYTIGGDNNLNIIGSNMYYSASAYYHVFIDRYGVIQRFSPAAGTTSRAYSIELIPTTASAGAIASSVALQVLNNGNIGIGTISPASTLDVSGSGRFTSGLTVTGSVIATSFTGSLSGSALSATSASFATTASYWSGSILNATSASFATTASYWSGSILNATSASFAATASRVNTLNQNVLITGSLTVGATSLGSNENTIAVGPPPAGGAGEGGQILLAAAGGTYTSASMLDTYQDSFRVLRGTNAGSDAFKLKVDLHSGQVQIPNYNSPTAFTGAPINSLATDTSGNILTVQGYSGIVTINTLPPVNFDIQNGIIVNVF